MFNLYLIYTKFYRDEFYVTTYRALSDPKTGRQGNLALEAKILLKMLITKGTSVFYCKLGEKCEW